MEGKENEMNEEKGIEVVEQSEMRLGILPARTPHDVIVQATKIAQELSKIIKEKGLSNSIQGRQFVRVEGWSTMGAMLGVLPLERSELGKRFDDGSYEATVELVRINDGAVIGRASALVGMDEKDRKGQLTWANRAEYARRSMAITRATGKAYRLGFSWIMTLAGYEATPAEEMGDVVEVEFKAESQKTNGNGIRCPTTSAPMTLDEAMVVQSSEGKNYGDIDTATLSHMANAISTAKVHKLEYDTKLLAIETILKARAKSKEPK